MLINAKLQQPHKIQAIQITQEKYNKLKIRGRVQRKKNPPRALRPSVKTIYGFEIQVLAMSSAHVANALAYTARAVLTVGGSKRRYNYRMTSRRPETYEMVKNINAKKSLSILGEMRVSNDSNRLRSFQWNRLLICSVIWAWTSDSAGFSRWHCAEYLLTYLLTTVCLYATQPV